MSNQIGQIRAEIERRRMAELDKNGNAKDLFCAVRLWAYADLLGIIDALPADVQETAEKPEIIFSTDGELTIYSFVGAPRWWATMREAEENLSVFKAGIAYERERMMKEAVECNVIWYDGRVLDFTQEQLDAALDKIGAVVDAKVSVIIIKKEK